MNFSDSENESDDETFFFSKEQRLLLQDPVDHDFDQVDFTEGGKYMIKSRVGYRIRFETLHNW